MKMLASRRGLEERILIFIVLAAGLFGLGVLLHGTGYLDFSAAPSATGAASITGFATGELGTQEEPLAAAPAPNLPPAYLGGSLSTTEGMPLAVDLAALFADPENDALTFLATQEDQVSVDVSGSIAVFTPAAGFAGERTITIVVSDGVSLLRQPVKFVVEGTTALVEEPAEPPAPEQDFGTQEFSTLATPAIAQVILNTTNPLTNDTNQNLTVFVINATDADNDVVQNITDFRVNGTSIAVLNMPFETNTTSVSGGAVRDYGIFGNNGTLGNGSAGNAPQWNNSGRIGGAYVFNGSTFIEINHSNSLNLVNNVTLEAWVYPFSNGSGGDRGVYVVTKSSNTFTQPFYQYALVQNNNCPQRFEFLLGIGGTLRSLCSNASMQVNSWQHIVGTYDGATAKIYVNGSLDNFTTQFSGSLDASLAPVHMGGLATSAANRYNGTIDEVQIYNRTLSAEQILLDFQRGNASRRIDGIVAQETTTGDVWTVCVTPNDNQTDGATVCSNNVTIAATPNAVPSVAQVILNTTNPLTNDTNQNLTVFVINATDADNDRVANITDWRVNNRSLALLNLPFENATNGVGSGLIRDYSQFGNNGTLGNGGATEAPSWNLSGLIGGHYVFDGVNDRITVPDSDFWAFDTRNFTMGLWVQFRAVNLGAQSGIPNNLLSQDNGGGGQNKWIFTLATTPTVLSFHVNNPGAGINTFLADTTFVPATDRWYHLAIRRNGTTFSIYVNGTKGATEELTGALPDAGVPFQISGAEGIGFINGYMDEVQVWNRSLSDEQIMQIYIDGNASRHVQAFHSNETSPGEIWSACVTPNDNQTDGGTVCSNTVTIASEAVAGVVNVSNVSAIKSDSPDPVNASSNLTYVINVTSNGNVTAFNVTVNDTYPAHVIFLASQPTAIVGTNDTFILGNLTSGTSVLVNITVLVRNVSNGTVINNSVNVTFHNDTGALLSRVALQSTTVLSANSAPSIAQVILNSTNPLTNDTNQNLTLFIVNATDADGNAVQNITDFRINGASWTVLNLPFETNTSSTASGAIRDYGVSGANATLGGSTQTPAWNQTGVLGGAYNFDGGDFLTSAATKPTQNLTFEFWVRPDVTDPVGIFDTAPGVGNVLRNFPAGYAEWWSGDPQVYLGLMAGNWYHVVLNYYFDDARHITYYRNGTLNQTVNGSATSTFEWSSPIRFGDINNGGSGAYDGEISEMRIYNRSLSPEEVVLLYNEGIAGKHPRTVHGNETVTGEIWSACVTPNDNQKDGGTVCSNNVTILAEQNATPGIASCFPGPVFINASTSLSQHISSNETCLVFNASNIVLNCAGFNITLNDTFVTNAILAVNKTNITVRDCIVRVTPLSTNFFPIVRWDNVSNSLFFNNSVVSNVTSGSLDRRGIQIVNQSNNNRIENNTFRTQFGSSSDVYAEDSHNLTISGNLFNSSALAHHPITLTGATVGKSENNTVQFNVIEGNTTDSTSNAISGGFGTLVENNNITRFNCAAAVLNLGSNNTYRSNRLTLRNAANCFAFEEPRENNFTLNVLEYVDSSFAYGVRVPIKSNFVDNNITLVNGSTDNRGIELSSGYGNFFIGNRISVSGSQARGISFGTTEPGGAENNTFVNNVVSVNGTAISLAIDIADPDTRNTTFNYTNVSVYGDNGYAVTSSSPQAFFNNTFLRSSVNWLNSSSGSFSNFTNTTFDTVSGSVNIPGTFQLNASQDVTNSKLAITFNRAFVNSTNLSFLNASAVITLRGTNGTLLTADFNDDGLFEECPTAICSGAMNLGTAVTFNVTQFTGYSSSEGGVIISLDKSDAPDPVSAGSTLNYTLLLNLTFANASNVTLTDVYPPQVVFQSAQPTPITGTNNTFVIGNLTVNATFTVNISVLVLSGILNGTILNNTANVSFQNATSDVIRFNVTENTTVSGAAALTCPDVSGTLTVSGLVVLNTSISCTQVVVTSTGRLRIDNRANQNASINISATNFTVAAGGIVEANGTGFLGNGTGSNGSGPGGGLGTTVPAGSGGGGGHGGSGGAGGLSPGKFYDRSLFPDEPGSGGGRGSGGPGANGGGAVVISAEFVSVNGTVLANGLTAGNVGGAQGAGGGGAGGTVRITTTTLEGVGIINASGGHGGDTNEGAGGSDGGGGGGGIIVLRFNTSTFPVNNTFVGGGAGGGGGSQTGLVGRTAFIDTDDNTISIRSGWIWMLADTTTWSFARINMTGATTLNNDSILTFLTQNLIMSGSSVNAVNGTQKYYNFTINATTVSLDGTSSIINATILNITTLNISLAAGSFIQSNLTGFLGASANGENGRGPGGGNATGTGTSAAHAGAGYGGIGGVVTTAPVTRGGNAYGSALNPLHLGSGGAGSAGAGSQYFTAGGGLVRITALTRADMNTTIIVSGGGVVGSGSSSGAGGGSGGAIYINATLLQGTMSLLATGGVGQPGTSLPTCSGAGGGGGRIIIIFANGSFPITQASVSGGGSTAGPGIDCGRAGAPGTLAVWDTDDNVLVFNQGWSWLSEDEPIRFANVSGNSSTVRTNASVVTITDTLAMNRGNLTVLNVSSLLNVTRLVLGNVSVVSNNSESRLHVRYQTYFDDIGTVYVNSSRITLENASVASIAWLQFSNTTGNLSGRTQLRQNRAFVNVAGMQGLNQTANITLFNTGLFIPRVRFDAEDDGSFVNCLPTAYPFCTALSNLGGVFVFNTSAFSAYASSEGGVSVNKSDNFDPVNVSSPLNYTIAANTTADISNLTLTDIYPPQVIFLTAQPTPITGTNNTFILGNLTNGTQVVVNISVFVRNLSRSLLLNNTANVTFQNATGALFVLNVTENTTVANAPPALAQVILNTTNVLVNDTDQNLTLFIINVTDQNSERVRNITDFRRNGTSIAAVNMPFEGGSNTTFTRDYSIYGRNGSVMSNPFYNATGGVDGGGAYQFNGHDQRINVQFNTTLQRFTVMAWIKTKSSDNDFQAIVSKHSYFATATTDFPFAFYAAGAGTSVTCFIDSGNDFSGDASTTVGGISTDVWSHVACVYDGINVSIYRNGTLASTSNATGITLSSNARNYTIGRAAFENAGQENLTGFNGTIDEVMIVNRSLSAEQIYEVFLAGNASRSLTTINAAETLTSEIWSACVTPNDNLADGATVCSNNLTILGPQEIILNVSNISVSKSDSPDPVENGTLLSYVINVTSTGNGTAHNVTVNDTYPNEVIFVSAQPSPLAGTNNTFILGNLSPGASILINITVNVTQVLNATVLNNSVNVTFNNDTSALLSRTDAESTTTTNFTQVFITGCPVTINVSTVLTQNLASNLTCITFGANDIYLDCAGFTITYGFNNTVPASGIVARHRNNITVVSCTVRDINASAAFSPAINFSNVSNSFVVNNTLLSNGTSDNYGIIMQFGSSFNTIANNTIFARGTSSANYGVRIFTNATNNTIANNTIVSNSTINSWAITMATFVQNNTIVNNTLTADASSSGGTGIRMETSVSNNFIANNTIVTRRPGASGNAGIFLFSATSNNQILNNSIRTNGTSNNGGITLSTTAQNNTVAYNLIFTGGSSSDNTGIQLTTNSHNNTVANNIVFTSGTVADDGVRISTTSNNNRVENNTLNTNGTSTFNRGVYVNAIIANTSIINNTITTGGVSSNDGIRLDTTVINTTIINNTITARGSAGPNAGINLLVRVNESTVRNNTIFTNGTTTNYGIIVQSLSINNTIANNRINTSGTTTINYGIYLLTSAENNTIDNNTIIATGNGQSHGIRLETSSNSNRFFNNNISTNDTGYGVFILNSNDTSFVNTRFSNASNWTSTSANSARNNFTNTTFEEGNRRLTYAALLTLNGAQDVTKHRLSLANNRVFLNGTNLTFLNRSAEIAYIGLSFDDPQVLIDREDDGSFIHCLFGFCNESSYANGEFVFVVPGFTTYATAEGNTTLIKADSIDPAVPGELLTYRITVEVSGNNASNATITDLYSPHVAFNTSEPPPLAGTNDTFILGNLTSGDTRVVNITVLVLNGSLNGVVINNTVNISYTNSTGNTVAFNTTENTTLVTGCPGTITSSTTLGQNVSSSGTCVTFGADGIFLDCAGFTITYGLTGTNDTSGINITSRNNSEVRNCVIVKTNGVGSRTHAIGIFNSSNTRLENNTLRTNGTAEADGIHSGVANTSEIVFTPAAINIVTNNNNVNSPYCTNASGVSACQVCFDTAGVNCAFLGQGGCTDGEGFKFDELIRFNVSNNTNVTGGSIKIIGGEAVVCDVNEVRVLTLSTRNNCGTFRSATINASAFRTGPNNLTCQVAGGGKDEDNGFKLVEFSYDGIVTTSQSLISGNSTNVTAVNNTILADSTTKARGIFLDAPGSVVMLNNVTNVGGDQSHGIVMGGENSTVLDNNITTYQGTGSNGVFVFAKNVIVTSNRVRASGDLQSVGILVLANDSVVAFNNISTTVGRENRGISLLASNANVTLNNISVSAANESHGIYVGGSNNTVAQNNVTVTTSGLSHAIFLEGGASRGNTVANNTLNVRGLGSDAIRVVLSTANTIADNAIINASLASMRVDRALNNVLLGTLPTALSALLIIEDDGTINFTQPLTLSNATNLSQVVTIAFNFTRVNTTHSAGQQLNRSAILQIFSLPTMGFRAIVDFEDDNTFVDCNSPQCRNATYNQTTGTLEMNVSSFTTYAGRAFPDCTTIDNEENQTTVNFTLETNLTAANNCFEIVGENVTLNCDNYTIFYDAAGVGADAIEILNTSGIVIKNCVIRDVNRGGAAGIGINATIVLNHSEFFNNAIFTNGTSNNNGIAIQGNTSNVTIRNNTIRTNGSAGSNFGIFMNGEADYVQIVGNTIRTNGSGSSGDNGFQILTRRFFYGRIENNSIDAGSTESGGSNFGMEVDRVNHTMFQGNYINTSPASNSSGSNFGLVIFDGNNNTVQRNTVVTSGDSSSFVIFFDGGSDYNTVMHNIAFGTTGDDHFGIFFDEANTGNIIVNNTINLSDTDDNFGILMEPANDTLIENNTIITCCSFSNYGIIITDALGSRGHNVTIKNNNISTCCQDDNEGIIIEVDNSTVSNNTVTTCCNDAFNPGIWVRGGNTVITGNVVRTNGTDGNEGILQDIGTSGVHIAFNDIVTHGTDVFNPGIDVSADNALIAWNNVSTNGTGESYGILAGGSNTTIANNIVNAFSINDTDGDGIYLGSSYGNSTIVNNTVTVYGNRSTGIFVDGLFLINDGVSVALRRSNMTNITIMNNTVSAGGFGIESHGILISGTLAQSTVRDNRILTENSTLSHGIFLFDNVTGNSIENNVISAFSNESYAVFMLGGPLAGFAFNDTFEDGTLDPFTTNGNANWTVTPESALNSTFGVRAGNLTASGQQSNLTLNINLPGVGTTYMLQFAVNQSVSSSDRLELRVDGLFQNSFSTNLSWTRITRQLSAGAHTLEWRFAKFTGPATNYIFIDNIEILPLEPVRNNSFVNNTLRGTHWLYLTEENANNTFTNTLFDEPNGSVRIQPTVTLPNALFNASKGKLNVTFNRAFLNSSNLSVMNVTGQIALRDITFPNPTPTFDFEDDGTFAACTSTANPFCTEQSYSGGVFTYNTSHFTTFSSEDQGGTSITLTKSDNPDPVNASAQLNYTVVVNVTFGNASNLTLTDVYPPQVVFQSAQPTPLAGTNNTFILGNFTNGTAVEVNITVLVLGSVANGTVINNTANFSFQNQTGSLLNQSVTEGTTVLAAVAAGNLSNCPVTINVSTTLTQNISAMLNDDQACITFGNSSIFLECAGFALLGNGSGRGILAPNVTNTSTRNCEVRHFRENIVLFNATNSSINNVTSLNGSRWAIASLAGSGIIIANSTASQEPAPSGSTIPAAIFVNNTNFSIVETNNASGQGGISFGGFENEVSFHVIVRGNNATSGSGTAFGTSDSAQVNITYVNNRGTTNGTNAFGLSLNDSLFVNNTGGSTSTNEASGFHGIFLRQGKNNNVTGNNGTSLHGVGILLRDVFNTTLADNVGLANRSAGIRITRGANNTLLRNNGTSNFSVGISVQHGRENALRDNIGKGETVPVSGGGGGGGFTGISLENSTFNVLVNNLGISNASRGIALTNVSAFNNLTGNNGTSNFSAGILLAQNSDNNTLVNNTARSLNNVALNLSGVAGNVLLNNTFTVNNGTAVLFEGTAINNVFGNSTLYTNGTWLFSGSSATGNNLTNTLFEGQNGSIRTFPNTTVPVSANVSVRTLNITYNASYLNSTAHGFLNLSSQVTLRNLTQSNPVPVSDFEDDGTFVTCPASICSEVSYVGGVFVFNATGFTTHAAGETQAVVNNASNLSVIKADSPDPVENGTQLNYTVTVTSNGNGTAYNVTLTETYPPEVVFNTAQPSPSSGNNTFILGNLTNGTVVVVNITVNVTQVANGTVINNSVNVTFQNETSALLSRTDAEGTTVQNVTAAPAPAPSPGQGGGSGGGGVGGVRSPVAQVEAPACLENWACEGWSSCSGGVQSRECYDLNQCNSTRFVPVTRRTCVPEPVSAGEPPRVLLQRLIAYIDPFPVSLWIVVFVILGIVFLTMASWKIGQRPEGQYRPPAVPRAPQLPPVRGLPKPRLSGYLKRVYGALDSGEEEARRFERKYAEEQRLGRESKHRIERVPEERSQALLAREQRRRELAEQQRLEHERRREEREERRAEHKRQRAEAARLKQERSLRNESSLFTKIFARKPRAEPVVQPKLAPQPVKLAPLPKLAPVKAQKVAPVVAQAVPRKYPSIVDKYLGAKDTKLKDVLDKAERTLAEKKDYGKSSREMQAILSKLEGSDSLLGRFKKKFRK